MRKIRKHTIAAGLALSVALAIPPVDVHAQAASVSNADSGKAATVEGGSITAEGPEAKRAPAKALSNTGYYVEPGAYGTRRETVPPGYTRKLSQTGIEAVGDIDWIDVGLDHRMRYELRDDDLRRGNNRTDNIFLLRTRAYLGVREVLDPLRLAIEVEDARSENGRYPRDDRDVNEGEPIQMVAELYFKNALGRDDRFQSRPISLKGGRMWFEKLDRRLIGNNGWRNTTNTFQGIHLDIGREANDWEVEFIAAQPLERKLYEFDRTNDGQWFYALIGHIRRWSEVVTVEPYYLAIVQDKDGKRTERSIHAPGVRAYGPVADTPAHYDVSLMYQTGEDNGRDHSALGATGELGWRFSHAWKPRASVFYGYASGDENPVDDSDQRFERFYGFARPWSASDYIQFENVHAPKTRFEITPLASLRADAGYSAYWLASDQDRWNAVRLQDPTGQSGDFMGHEFDLRVRWAVNTQLEATVGYAHFEPGNFTQNMGRSDASDFVYLEISLNAFPKI
jgi:hypothetical protein